MVEHKANVVLPFSKIINVNKSASTKELQVIVPNRCVNYSGSQNLIK